MRHLIKITDLPAADYMFYIGDLVEVDGSGWVDEDAALALLTELNTASKVDLPLHSVHYSAKRFGYPRKDAYIYDVNKKIN